VYGEFSVESSVEEGVRQLRRLVNNVQACGAAELLLGGTADPQQYDRYYEALRQVCDEAYAKGIGLCLKPHGGLNATGSQCREAIERVDHRNFRLWYDPGNILYYSDGKRQPLEDVLEIDGLVVGMSVKDFQAPKQVEVTPGTGLVNFPALFARMQLGGFRRGLMMVECTAGRDFAEVTKEAQKARRYVESLVQGRAFDSLSVPADETPR
jgi:sugar phosphate isomerase/epimerase